MVLCETSAQLEPKVLKLVLHGILAVTISALGRKLNPLIGIATVSCEPTTTASIAEVYVATLR